MTEAGAPGSIAPKVGANVWFFAGIYLAISVVLSVLFAWLQYAGTPAPNGVSVGASIGGFVAAVGIAGHRFASKSAYQWTREDRKQLAFGYVVASLIVSLVLVGGLTAIAAALDPETLRQMIGAGQSSIAVLAIIFAVALAVVALLEYVLARYMLGQLETAHRRATAAK